MGSKELLSIVPSARRLYSIGVVLSILGSIALVAWTISLAQAISNFVQGQPYTPALVALAGFLALRIGFSFVSSQVLATSSSQLRSGVRAALTSRWSANRVELTSTGIDSTLLGPGVDSLDDYVAKFLPARSVAAVLPIVVFLTIGFLDPWTLLILIFAGPMLILLLAVIGSRTRELSEQRFRELGWLRSFYLDMVRGIPTLKVFGRASESVTAIEDVSDRFGRTTMSVLRTAFQTSLVIEWAATAATALVAVQVSFRLVEGNMGFGAALTVLMLTPEFFAPLRNLAIEYHAGQAGNAALEQLPDLTAPELPPTSRSTVSSAPPAHPPSIRFENVSFLHPGSDQLILDSVSFTITAGESVVLIGPSGVGKSTLLGLLQGRLSPTQGQITIDNKRLTDIDPQEWLRSITSVPQNPFMFSSSVKDNVALSNQSASADQIHDALDLALASEFVAELPLGIDSKIGEEGATLSGGQRQRLAIARAVLRDAPLVLLDEFTAHLDPVTEREMIRSLGGFLDDRTAVIVAHREATLSLADRILELANGRIVEVPQ
ncbi:MAG: thiol reductant ABC exporter subunit CydD [Actinobacteria bacterium]|jgi:thiol reductant ABC exporter CydD subunit|nr:thiol reductant ABC exporter subunit CydD [Actinomycetota bacterium]MCG9477690.1 thiol reductant ABC exporter subunit CydD [Actinomycetes bacterium]